MLINSLAIPVVSISKNYNVSYNDYIYVILIIHANVIYFIY